MQSISQILKTKGNDVWSISPGSTVYQGLEMLAEKEVGALVVINNIGKVVGMFSERDYARKVILKGKSSLNTLISDLMTTDIQTVEPTDSIEKCMSLMSERRIRHLPVLKEGELIGMLSIGDVVNYLISHQQFTIKQLEKYITGA